MRKIVPGMCFVVLLCGVSGLHAQSVLYSFSLSVKDNIRSAPIVLSFGLDTAATDGIDAALGESELPPLPPTGVFDVRFVGRDIALSGLGNGVLQDFRNGGSGFNGTKTHEISYQRTAGASSVTISWNLRPGVTGTLQDIYNGVVYNKSMSGKDSLIVTNPGITSLKMFIQYQLLPQRADDDAARPVQFLLSPAYPNPFNPSTSLSLTLPAECAVSAVVYDLLGREVACLHDGALSAGVHTLVWQAAVSGGVYFVTVRAFPVSDPSRVYARTCRVIVAK